MTTIAIVGAGFVADYYMTTLANHPALGLAGSGIMMRSGLQFTGFQCQGL
jgi:hypothetical protein